MRILYVSTLCSDKKFNDIFNSSTVKPQQQAQKFHKMLANGFKNTGSTIEIMSILPMNKNTNKKTFVQAEREYENGVKFRYIPIINLGILKYFSVFIFGIIYIIGWLLKSHKENKVIICDSLNLSITLSALFISKLLNIKIIGIVTDIPSYMQNYSKQKVNLYSNVISKIYVNLCGFVMKLYSGYVILTKDMNNLINMNNKPYIVMEGLVDICNEDDKMDFIEKYDKKIVIYAGALHEKYGVKKLIDAFTSLEMDNAELWVYGAGELDGYISQMQLKNKCIKYFGTLSNEQIIKEEKKATLLVNPRPSDEEFAKYSFPSKNMEYMVSGTPILTTRLPGMPEEYYPFVYCFDDESVEGMAKTLKLILEKNEEELKEKGCMAKQFVLEQKNNNRQAKRISDMFEKC